MPLIPAGYGSRAHAAAVPWYCSGDVLPRIEFCSAYLAWCHVCITCAGALALSGCLYAPLVRYHDLPRCLILQQLGCLFVAHLPLVRLCYTIKSEAIPHLEASAVVVCKTVCNQRSRAGQRFGAQRFCSKLVPRLCCVHPLMSACGLSAQKARKFKPKFTEALLTGQLLASVCDCPVGLVWDLPRAVNETASWTRFSWDTSSVPWLRTRACGGLMRI